MAKTELMEYVFKNAVLVGKAYVPLVCCEHTENKLRDLGMTECPPPAIDECLATVGVAQCSDHNPECLQALLNDTRKLPRHLACPLDPAIFNWSFMPVCFVFFKPDKDTSLEYMLSINLKGIIPEYCPEFRLGWAMGAPASPNGCAAPRKDPRLRDGSSS